MSYRGVTLRFTCDGDKCPEVLHVPIGLDVLTDLGSPEAVAEILFRGFASEGWEFGDRDNTFCPNHSPGSAEELRKQLRQLLKPKGFET